MTLHEWALKYASMGIPVFPLVPYGKKPPYGSSGHLAATTDPATINKWWKTTPSANIGGACGVKFVVIDADPGSEEYLEKGLLDGAPRQTTPRGGPGHFFYRLPTEPTVGRVTFLPKLDFRCKGNYVVLSPSVVKQDGKIGKYQWVNGGINEGLPELPEWALRRVRQHNPERDAEDKEHRPFNEPIEDGGRNVELTSRIGKVAARGLPYEELITIALGLNAQLCKPPLSESEVKKIVASVAKRENAKEKTPPKPFEVKTWDQMLHAYANKEETFAIEEWVPDATCALITAPPGMYKTWLVSEAALCLATGKPFLNKWTSYNPGPVLIIQQEDPFGMLIERMTQIMNIGQARDYDDGSWSIPDVPREIPIQWHTNREFRFDDPKIIKALSDFIHDVKPKAVILDPLYAAGDTDDYMAKTAKQMLFFKTLRDEVGTSFLVVHHSGKSGEKPRARDQAWGSVFLNAWLETGWQMMDSEENANVAVHRHFKSSGVKPIVHLNFHIAPGVFRASVIESGTLLENDTLKLQILKQEIEAGNVRSIADAKVIVGNCTIATAQRYLNKLGAYKRGAKYTIAEIVMLEETD